MAAVHDTDSHRDFWDVARGAITPEFLTTLGDAFEFDGTTDRAEFFIVKGAALYIRGRRIEDHLKAREIIASYLHIQKIALELKGYLDADDLDIAWDMDEVAEQSKEPLPYIDRKGRKPSPLDHIGSYWDELIRLLKLFDKTLEQRIQGIEPDKGGRPQNLGMPDFMQYVADFWEYELHRRFTVDYHQGSGTSDAFDFVKTILLKIDDVPDTQIITAMRRQIRERSDHINRPPR